MVTIDDAVHDLEILLEREQGRLSWTHQDGMVLLGIVADTPEPASWARLHDHSARAALTGLVNVLLDYRDSLLSQDHHAAPGLVEVIGPTLAAHVRRSLRRQRRA